MKYFFANWKMYLNAEESVALATSLRDISFDQKQLTLVVFPNILAFAQVRWALDQSTISVGAQNVSWVPKGAYTGAVSALLFQEAGATHALVGHSERRYIFGESDEDVRKKIDACLDVNMIPVLCVGDTKEDRENGKAEYRIKKQLMKACDGLSLAPKRMIVAYEPVWAISEGGHGTPCEPEEAVRMMNLIREELKGYTDVDIPLVYGGSVTEGNVLSYVSLQEIDGVLCGHASTKHDSVMSMLEACKTA